jgi:signal transduction histidine kinase
MEAPFSFCLRVKNRIPGGQCPSKGYQKHFCFSAYVVISIRRTGIGMSPGMVSTLFSLHQQINRKGTRGEPGLGLRLLLCREFTNKLGGKI